MPTGGRCNVAVFDRHRQTGLIEYSLLFRPNVSHRHVESVNTPVECIHEPRKPCLQGLTLSPFFGANPVGQLRDDNSARVAAILLYFEQAITRASPCRLAGWEMTSVSSSQLTACACGQERGGAAAHHPG